MTTYCLIGFWHRMLLYVNKNTSIQLIPNRVVTPWGLPRRSRTSSRLEPRSDTYPSQDVVPTIKSRRPIPESPIYPVWEECCLVTSCLGSEWCSGEEHSIHECKVTGFVQYVGSGVVTLSLHLKRGSPSPFPRWETTCYHVRSCVTILK